MKGDLRDQQEFRNEHALVSANPPNLDPSQGMFSLLNFLRNATPAELRAHNKLVLEAHEKSKKARLQWQKDHEMLKQSRLARVR